MLITDETLSFSFNPCGQSLLFPRFKVKYIVGDKFKIVLEGIIMFGRKNTIELSEQTNKMIEQASGGPFKKKSMITIPKGYEVILIEADGTSEIIRNVHQYKLDRNVHAIFYAKKSDLVQTTKWGTRSRIPFKTKEGEDKTLGAFGTLTFQLANPLRYINKKMNTDEDFTPDALKNMVIDKITDIIKATLDIYGPIDPDDPTLNARLKKDVLESLDTYLDDYGIRVDDFLIEAINTNQ